MSEIKASTIEEFNELTTRYVTGINGVVYKVTVLPSAATAKLYSILPEGELKGETLKKFCVEHLKELTEDIIYHAILEPEVPPERLAFGTVFAIFTEVYTLTFGSGDEFQ